MQTPRNKPLAVSARIVDSEMVDWIDYTRARYGLSSADIVRLALLEKLERDRARVAS